MGNCKAYKKVQWQFHWQGMGGIYTQVATLNADSTLKGQCPAIGD